LADVFPACNKLILLSLQIQGHSIVIRLQIDEDATENVLHWDNLYNSSAYDMTTKEMVS
jgi:hypothetical protein